jgi:hypothetical protein
MTQRPPLASRTEWLDGHDEHFQVTGLKLREEMLRLLTSSL